MQSAEGETRWWLQWIIAQIKKTFNSRYNVENMFLEDFIYKDWFVPPLEGDIKVPFKSPLEGERKK